ncbi:MAG: ATP phosphoribosyltransferase regulatory subunit, partial [Pseudomonadota bacterium]
MTSIDKKIEPRRLKGFRDYMPDLMESRSRFQGSIRHEAALAGFREIGTPVLEYAETLLGQGSDETDKQVYRFEDHGGRKVAMRFDLTIPFARFVAEHQGELVFPFKRLQIGDVWRGENTQKGRYREFCQCDLDIIGVDSVNADVEILSCFYRILSGFDLGGFTMRLGNRVLLSAMLAKAFPGIDVAGESGALI